MTAEALPTWEHIKDPDLLAFLRGLPMEEQIKLKDRDLDFLDRARGDAIMAEVIGSAPPRIPFPPGWQSFSDQEKDDWRNNVFIPQQRALNAQDQANRRAAARGEIVD